MLSSALLLLCSHMQVHSAPFRLHSAYRFKPSPISLLSSRAYLAIPLVPHTMANPCEFDPVVFHEAVLTAGYSDVPVDIEGEIRLLRFTRPEEPGCLSSAGSPPPFDADMQAAMERLRQRLRRVLNLQAGPPVLVTTILVSLFGNRGTPLSNTSEGLRLLLSVPALNSIDWSTFMSFAPVEPSLASHVAPADARMDQVEARLLTLSTSMQDLQRTLASQVAAAVSQALAAHAPPPAPNATPSPPNPGRGLSAMDTAEDAPPSWEFKSSSPVMEVLGTIYAHLVASGHTTLAAELYGVRGAIDYAFLPATQADPSDTEHVYQAVHSGKKWKTDRPPPRPCYTCGQMHWGKDCPVKAQHKQETASQAFPRGKPPARYYISKGGQCCDSRRRPNVECKRCGRFHWWWACPKAPDTLHVPRGAKFVDKTDLKPVNASSARFKPQSHATSSESATPSDESVSSAAEILPQKRSRKHRPAASGEQPHQSHSPVFPPMPSGLPPNPAGPSWPWPYPGWPPVWNPYMGYQPLADPQRQQRPQQPPAPAGPGYSEATPTPPPPPPPQQYAAGAGPSTVHQPYWAPPESGAAHPSAY